MRLKGRPLSCMSVDVGINALGWAWWDWAADNRTALVAPELCGVLHANRKLEWSERLICMLDEFEHVLTDNITETIVLEYAEFRPGSAVGMAAAAKDSLTQLAFAAGAHAWMAYDMYGASGQLVKPSEWKGQLPKRVVEERIHRTIGNKAQDGTKFNTHAWDAVGLGLWAKGYPMDHAVFARKGVH